MSQQYHRPTWGALIVGAFVVAAFFTPGAARATDPVERLREALKIEPGVIRTAPGVFKPDPKTVARRDDQIQSAIDELKKTNSISLLRRAYFLSEWSSYHLWVELNLRIEKKAKEDKQPELRGKHAELGDLLASAIRAAAKDPSADKRLALALLLAEMEGAPQLPNAKPKEKFARQLTDVVCALANDRDNLAIRQAGLHALGRITPIAGQAFPVFEEALQKDTELGPRRLAAHALSELAANARVLQYADRLKTIELVVSTAALGLSKNNDEQVRGLCLQAVEESARALMDYILEFPTLEEQGKRKLVLDVKEVLQAYQAANPEFVKCLGAKEPKLRLASVQALDQIGQARLKILRVLQDLAPDKSRGELFEEFKTPDPLAEKAKGSAGLVKAAGDLLDPAGSVAQRRGAINLLEMLGEKAEPVASPISQALEDPDRFVRWTAARTIRALPPERAGPQAVAALAVMAKDVDPDLSRSAAEAIEALGPAARAAAESLGKVIANGADDQRRWDVETRVAAMKALISTGSTTQQAFSDVLTALSDEDVRVRRKAAETLGRLGRPADTVAQRAIATLTEALRDEPDSEVRLNISEAILSIARKKGL